MTTLTPYLRIPFLLIAASIVLSLTSIYAISIAIVIGLFAFTYPLISTGPFRTISTRLVASFLVFSAWVMLVGFYGWIIQSPLPAYAYIIGYIALYLLAYYKLSPKNPSDVEVESSRAKSVTSLLLSLAGVAIIVSSFYLPSPTLSSSIQIITNGYDNTAHLSLIHTTYSHESYVYGSYNDIKDDIAWKTLTAYPQGWHLATAFTWKGLGQPVFSAASASSEINLYVITLLTWYFIMAFLFHQILWYFLQKARLATKINILHITTFTGLSLLLQLLVFWGSLAFGFTTFICALAYLFLLSAIILHAREIKLNKNSSKNVFLLFILALTCVMAITQGWLFAMPIAVISTLFGFFFIIPYALKNFAKQKMAIISVLLASILILIPILVQFLINQEFSTQGTNQINDDGGIFGISTTLALVTVVGALVGLSSKLIRDRKLRTTLAIIVLPALGFCTLLLLYQLFSIGHTAYFFTKSLALTLCLVWIPLSCLVFSLVNNMQNNLPKIAIFGIISISFIAVPLMLGQDISSFNKLLQRNSNLTTESAQKVADLSEDGTLKSRRTLVLTGQNYDGDAIGSIFTTTQGALSRDQCIGEAMWTIVTRRNQEFPFYANKCTLEHKVQVVTSPDTDDSILQSLNEHIIKK